MWSLSYPQCQEKMAGALLRTCLSSLPSNLSSNLESLGSLLTSWCQLDLLCTKVKKKRSHKGFDTPEALLGGLPIVINLSGFNRALPFCPSPLLVGGKGKMAKLPKVNMLFKDLFFSDTKADSKAFVLPSSAVTFLAFTSNLNQCSRDMLWHDILKLTQEHLTGWSSQVASNTGPLKPWWLLQVEISCSSPAGKTIGHFSTADIEVVQVSTNASLRTSTMSPSVKVFAKLLKSKKHSQLSKWVKWHMSFMCICARIMKVWKLAAQSATLALLQALQCIQGCIQGWQGLTYFTSYNRTSLSCNGS